MTPREKRDSRFEELDRAIQAGPRRRGPDKSARQDYYDEPLCYRDSVSTFFLPNPEAAGLARLTEIVAKLYRVNPQRLRTVRSNAPNWCHPRALLFYVARNDLRISWSQLGRIYHRDHTCVMSAVRFMARQLEKSEAVRMLLAQVRESLAQPQQLRLVPEKTKEKRNAARGA